MKFTVGRFLPASGYVTIVVAVSWHITGMIWLEIAGLSLWQMFYDLLQRIAYGQHRIWWTVLRQAIMTSYEHTSRLRWDPFRSDAARRSGKSLMLLSDCSFSFPRLRPFHPRMKKDVFFFLLTMMPWFRQTLDNSFRCVQQIAPHFFFFINVRTFLFRWRLTLIPAAVWPFDVRSTGSSLCIHVHIERRAGSFRFKEAFQQCIL